MAKLGFYHTVLEDLERTHVDLRGRCKAFLYRLSISQLGVDSGLDIQMVDKDHGILELKIKWNKQEFRILFYRHGGEIYVVNYFQKKKRKTPPNEIKIAISRRKDIELDRKTITYNGLQ